jgi:hypothetical protein
MNIDANGTLQEEIITLRDLEEGDLFTFPYEQRIRYLMQKGRIEGCCPYLNGICNAKDEVYHLSAKVIKTIAP